MFGRAFLLFPEHERTRSQNMVAKWIAAFAGMTVGGMVATISFILSSD